MKPDNDEFEFDVSRRLKAADEAIRRSREQPELEASADPELPADLQWDVASHEAWLREMAAMESGDHDTTMAAVLEADGVELPPADSLSDEVLTRKLMEVVRAMAEHQAFLHATNHLSDRELYIRLREDVLQEEVYLPTLPGAAVHFDLVSSGSEEDIRLYLMYYADDAERQRWAEEFPEIELPPKRPHPFDRDRFLPGRDL